MREIKMNNCKLVALVDDEDYDRVSKFSWNAYKSRRVWYALTSIGHTTYSMHRLVMKLWLGNPIRCDHKDGNGLDNRKSNLRLATNAQNLMNKQLYLGSKSGFKGVTWAESAKKWCARIRCNKKLYSLGYFTNKVTAAQAYDRKARILFGEFANLNFPDTIPVDGTFFPMNLDLF